MAMTPTLFIATIILAILTATSEVSATENATVFVWDSTTEAGITPNKSGGSASISCQDKHATCGNGHCDETLFKLTGMFRCVCDFGYHGERCGQRCDGDCQDGFPSPSNARYADCNILCVHGLCDKALLLEQGLYRCICDPGWVGDLCNAPCDLNCPSNGACAIHPRTQQMFCNCYPYWSGEGCEERVDNSNGSTLTVIDEPTWHWYVIGASVAVLCILIAAAILLPCLLKRRPIFMLKMTRRFMPSFEDDEGKKFDAFISYKSGGKDEDFVLHKLYQILEIERGFKLCLHFEEATCSDVIDSIENSSRTILLITPRYIESEWNRSEYQKAQAEMLKVKHQIILIILGNINEHVHKIDAKLRDIIASGNCIHWPEDEEETKVETFWKRLELTLPKKRKQLANTTSGCSTGVSDGRSSVGTEQPKLSTDQVAIEMKSGSYEDVSAESGDGFVDVDIESENDAPRIDGETNAPS